MESNSSDKTKTMLIIDAVYLTKMITEQAGPKPARFDISKENIERFVKFVGTKTNTEKFSYMSWNTISH